MPVPQHQCKCGSDQVSMVPAGGGRGTNDSLFFTGQCEACGFSMDHLPENSDGRRATAIRDWNREIKAQIGRGRPPTHKAVAANIACAQVGAARQSARQAEVPREHRSATPEQLRALADANHFNETGKKLLLDAAAEIEGSEEAYAILVGEIRTLREKLAHTEKNLRATIELVPSSYLV